MFTLRVSHDWAAQIQQIRDAVTEDSNLIRFDNAFYRVCRAGEQCFDLLVQPRGGGSGGRGVRMTLRERDLYVLHVNGRLIEQYAKTLDRLRGEPMSLDNALYELAKPSPERVFELNTLVVFCVAESLRNDHIATAIGQVIRTSTTGLIGAPTMLPIVQMRAAAHLWGQASEAIFQALSPAARDIALRPRAQLTPLQRRFSERVDLSRVDGRLLALAREVKVLKRPG
jgi:hypothetical protein